MNKLQSIIVHKKGPVASLILNRPHVHNALNLQMIRDLSGSLERLNRDKNIRIIVLSAEGENFSAGADLNWMRDGLNQEKEQLEKESLELAGLFRTLQESTAVSIASVKGRIMGGAIGLVAAADLVIADVSSSLAFSEVKLGLIPATIAPYILRKAGYSRTLDWMLTGRNIAAPEAMDAGLFHRLCAAETMGQTTNELIADLLSNGPLALKGVKDLLAKLGKETDPAQVDEYHAKLIAAFRISPEGQEGMNAFFEKRNPVWNDSP